MLMKCGDGQEFCGSNAPSSDVKMKHSVGCVRYIPTAEN